MTGEAHVAGVVVHAYPDAAAAVARRIGRLRGARVHAQSPDGKLVVTLEAGSSNAVAEALCRIQTQDGVLAAALVYQHAEPSDSMNEEVDLEDHAP
ncbi:MAG: chaperone NapD [Burkholderiales bacterium]|nr:chaperone NapD [Burkholderiales bacterium]